MLKRISFSLECAGLLYLICATVSLLRLWHEGAFNSFSIFGVLSPPAIASMLFFLVSMLVPDLLGQCSFDVPLNMTLPVVYLGLMFMALELGPGTEIPIVRLHQLYSWSLVWEEPGMLLVTGCIQIVSLSLLTRKIGKRSEFKPVE